MKIQKYLSIQVFKYSSSQEIKYSGIQVVKYSCIQLQFVTWLLINNVKARDPDGSNKLSGEFWVKTFDPENGKKQSKVAQKLLF